MEMLLLSFAIGGACGFFIRPFWLALAVTLISVLLISSAIGAA